MTFEEIKTKMLNDLDWVTSLSDEQQTSVLDELAAAATTYDEWKFVHWCDWPKTIQGTSVKRSQALLRLVQLAETDEQISEAHHKVESDLNNHDNQFWAGVDMETTRSAEKTLVDVLISKYRGSLRLGGFACSGYFLPESVEKMKNIFFNETRAERKEWLEHYLNYRGNRGFAINQAFLGITPEEVMEFARMYERSGGSVSPGGDGTFLGNFKKWLETATIDWVILISDQTHGNFKGCHILKECWTRVEKERRNCPMTMTNEEVEKIAQIFEGKNYEHEQWAPIPNRKIYRKFLKEGWY